MKVTGQNTMPDVLTKSPLKEQLIFLDEHTKIYENYRAIREDMFQKLKVNVSDTLSVLNNKIDGLDRTRLELKLALDSLKASLKTTKTDLEEMTRTKNSISVLGIDANKSTYNKLMWTVLAGLIAALLIGFLVFKRNLTAIMNSKKEFQELKAEFEAYRKSSREAREKLTMDHFNEIKKLRGS
jgi:hypothetical protein